MTDVPVIVRMSSAKISGGIAMSTSTTRELIASNQPPIVAASNPKVAPSVKASAVVTSAMPTVLRAPKIRRDKTSRPKASVPK